MISKEFTEKDSKDKNFETVFVYGTLLTGMGNWRRLLAPTKGIPAEISDYIMISLGYFPGIIPVPDNQIKGELFLVDKELLGRLDTLEGHPTFYLRTKVRTTEGTETWTYVYQKRHLENIELIESGDWRDK